jgi:hydroxypyruvate isomerase
MPRFAANLSMMFNEVPFLDRFEAAAKAGFTAVEFLFPYDHPAEEVGKRLRANGLTQALFNLPPGNWDAGEKGFAALPERFADLQQSLRTALPYAQATGVKRLHLMAGIASRSNARAVEAFYKSVAWTAEFFAPHGLDVVIEPINSRNVPGYFLNDFSFARDLIVELKIPNLKLQFDIYHCQIIHGDVTMRLREMMPITGHVQIASIPSRNEPDGEELNYPFLFAELDRLGYGGLSVANTTRAPRRRMASAGSSPTPEQSRDPGAGLHRRRLHRRFRSRQYADPLRPAHGADHRRAVGRSGIARGRRGGGVAEEPLDRGRACGVALARRRKMAARPGR